MLSDDDHVHADTLRTGLKNFQVYPRALCQAVLEGIAAQKLLDKKKLRWHEMMGMEEVETLAELASVELDLGSNEKTDDDLHDDHGQIAFDDVSGDSLCPSMVRRA